MTAPLPQEVDIGLVVHFDGKLQAINNNLVAYSDITHVPFKVRPWLCAGRRGELSIWMPCMGSPKHYRAPLPIVHRRGGLAAFRSREMFVSSWTWVAMTPDQLRLAAARSEFTSSHNRATVEASGVDAVLRTAAQAALRTIS